jgi:hypothetical protein
VFFVGRAIEHPTITDKEAGNDARLRMLALPGRLHGMEGPGWQREHGSLAGLFKELIAKPSTGIKMAAIRRSSLTRY